MNSIIKDLLLLRRANWFMAFVTGLLLVIGVLFIYSSCWVSDVQPVRTLWLKQILWIVVGIFCYLACAVFNYGRFKKMSHWVYGGCSFLLLLVLFIGTSKYGARRWLMLFGIGIQPSELAKLAMVIMLAAVLSRPDMRFESFGPIGFVIGIVAVPFFLILMEPDLGTAMIFLPTAFVMMFAGGVRLKILGVFAGIGLLAVGILLGALLLPEKLNITEERQKEFFHSVGLKPYQVKRIKVSLGLLDDPLGAEYNSIQSRIAVGSGGLLGKGFKKGTQNTLGFLPYSVAPTDFIYSVIAEEKGFVGSAVVLILYGLIMAMGLVTAVIARDKLGRLLCTGIVTMIFCHVFINIAMTVGMMPVTGLPLPLLSYGGSIMVVMMSSLGIIQSVYIRSRRIKAI